jgi:hypothetical protein
MTPLDCKHQVVTATRARYVKLGPGGCWEDKAIDAKILRVDFDTGSPETYQLCTQGRWGELAADWARSKSKGVATRFTNETRIYFEDQGEILWCTFAHDKLYWGFLEPGLPEIHDPLDSRDTSTFRRVRGGWSCMDLAGNVLAKARLPGSLTSAASYRGTSFELSTRERERLLRRINVVRDPAVALVEDARTQLRASLITVIQRLGPDDFETLVDMMFLAAGWHRLGRIGGNQRTKDLDLRMPITGERAWVQVKCSTSQQDFRRYMADAERMDQYERMFYVYHTGPELQSDRDDVSVVGPDDVADMVLRGGFVDWVLERVD